MLRPLVATALLASACKGAPASTAPETNTPPATTGAEGQEAMPAVTARSGTAPAEAERQLAARRSSRYSHQTHVDEGGGVFEYDCSGFVNYTLRAVAPAAFGEVAAVRPRPTARSYHDFFVSLPKASSHWQPVVHANELQRGDLVAWLEPADAESTNTGHVVIVDAAPVADAKRSEVSVVVIDSARSGHGTTDTRPKGEGGLGRGPIVLELDSQGKPRAFRWSPEKNSKPHEVSIAMGRVVEGGK